MHNEYRAFLKLFDEKLKSYFEIHKDYIYCACGCSECCEKGDYPISNLELEYLMQGFIELDNKEKKQVQENLKNIEKGGACPFLLNKQCSIYPYRPIICRVHGIAYLCKEKTVKVPYCVNSGKNYHKVYKDGEININPVLENLDTPQILKDFDYGEIRNLVDWLK